LRAARQIAFGRRTIAAFVAAIVDRGDAVSDRVNNATIRPKGNLRSGASVPTTSWARNLMNSQNYCIFLNLVLSIFPSTDAVAALPSSALAMGFLEGSAGAKSAKRKGG
jgi:hypothetical protein